MALQPWRWYRIVRPDSTLWMESSDPDEVMEKWSTIKNKYGWRLERLWREEIQEWRSWDDVQSEQA